jgi:hypothetical protein
MAAKEHDANHPGYALLRDAAKDRTSAANFREKFTPNAWL